MSRKSESIVLQFVDWLQKKSARIPTVVEFFGAYNDFLNAHGFKIFRANFASRSLHPQFGAVSLIWSDRDNLPQPPANTGILNASQIKLRGGYMNQLRILKFNIDSPGQAFLESPMAPVLLKGRTVREKIRRTAKTFKYPILKDLRDLDGTDYLALPVYFRGTLEAFISFATTRVGGFTATDIADMKRMTNLFIFSLEARLKDELIGTLLKLYLGETTGPQVLAGRIQRGDMENFQSVVWFSDIRGFSAMSSIMQPEEIIELLNTYYETIIPVVREYGGEVLKFLGDGLLVIFSAREGKERQVKYQSLIAANAAGRALKKLNERRISEGKIPLEHGIGLHYGLIQYGNIGSHDRLDFTAVGSAVNIASRVAALCSELGRSVLISADLARLLLIRLDSHGQKELKGIPQPVEIFSLPMKRSEA
jgi:adenylate cyclase